MPYHQFHDDEGFNDYGSFETFYVSPDQARKKLPEEAFGEPGWYWWPCFPGCLPDGEASGPFESEKSAINDAQT